MFKKQLEVDNECTVVIEYVISAIESEFKKEKDEARAKFYLI